MQRGPVASSSGPRSLTEALTPRQRHAVHTVIGRVRGEMPANLVHAALFGSRARGDARPDSDVDLLLIFQNLPPDREPHATHAEAIADQEARRLRVPVTVWSVSRIDLDVGNRTPMLVDALADAIAAWENGEKIAPISFTPADLAFCTDSLLRRVEEGSEWFAHYCSCGDAGAAAQRVRDDLVRLCTAHLLRLGFTRPRRAAALQAFRALYDPDPSLRPVLDWAEGSFGPRGIDEDSPVGLPPGGLRAAAAAIDRLRSAFWVARRTSVT